MVSFPSSFLPAEEQSNNSQPSSRRELLAMRWMPSVAIGAGHLVDASLAGAHEKKHLVARLRGLHRVVEDRDAGLLHHRTAHYEQSRWHRANTGKDSDDTAAAAGGDDGGVDAGRTREENTACVSLYTPCGSGGCRVSKHRKSRADFLCGEQWIFERYKPPSLSFGSSTGKTDGTEHHPDILTRRTPTIASSYCQRPL